MSDGAGHAAACMARDGAPWTRLFTVPLPRMALRVRLLQVRDRHRGVDLRRVQRGVPEQLLDVTDVRLVPEHQRRAGVPERVRGDFLHDLRPSGTAAHDLPDDVPRHAPTT